MSEICYECMCVCDERPWTVLVKNFDRVAINVAYIRNKYINMVS